MQLTDYHAKYFAYELTKRCSSDSVEKLAGAVASAQVDLNLHQVDASGAQGADAGFPDDRCQHARESVIQAHGSRGNRRGVCLGAGHLHQRPQDGLLERGVRSGFQRSP